MPKYLIERAMPGVGSLPPEALASAAAEANKAVATLAPRVQWQHSYVTGDKIFCVYLADDEDAVREHAQLAGLPANVVTEIKGVVDPTAGNR
jgi:hypothetical protein